jgi:hypothetical protein
MSKRYYGKALRYSFIYPNPANHKKYCLVIGANNNDHSWENIKNLALQGWYDYEVWDSNTIVDAGYFDENWMRNN